MFSWLLLLFICCLGLFLLSLFCRCFPFFLAFDAQGRHSFQDCHHRHDERSTGAKKKSTELLIPPGWIRLKSLTPWICRIHLIGQLMVPLHQW